MHQCLYEDDIRFLHNKPNIYQHRLKILYNAAKSNQIVFNIADKNLGLCINDTTWYMDEYSRHLSDTHTYQELDYNLLTHILDTSISKLHGLYHKYLRNPPKHESNKDIKSFYKRKTYLDIKLPSLNIVPKPHKLKQKASTFRIYGKSSMSSTVELYNDKFVPLKQNGFIVLQGVVQKKCLTQCIIIFIIQIKNSIELHLTVKTI